MVSKLLYLKTVQSAFLLCVLCLQLFAATTSAETLDRVVAVVNDDIITLSDLNEAGKDFLQKVQESAPKGEMEQATREANERVLSQLINQQLITQEAQKANVQLSDNEFNQAYEKNFQALNISREEFLKKLGEAGLTEEVYEKNLRNQLLRDKLILYEVRSKIIITEEMINQYYNNEYAGEVEDGGYYLLQIGFLWDTDDAGSLEAAKENARKRAEEIHKLAVDGGDFGELARKHSELPTAADGGDLGIFDEDDMADYMRDVVLPLKAGDISSVVETPIGYQFFKILSRQEGDVVHQAPFYEVKEEIRKKLFEREFKQQYQSWVEEIKQGAYIKKML